MPSFHAMYPKPDDVEGFEAHYRETHMPLAETWPGDPDLRVTRVTGSPMGEPAYHLVFVATWDDDESMKQALRSEEMKLAGQDLQTIAERFGIQATIVFGADF